ncbi:hypothetical protein KIH39_22110 [Telmatocola sphagniphila]|uniref:Uncharacterized protein n=1 Tax=Telmatocola sphagniphila TaxID=1123043 RepID=A0A8E6B3Y6_9BACT|nr:hypothetical protein [Telmatocola sphagniphila]QVL31513.1 hypothetical protein KIH39_22110 [Telmatocola sphagniphila]
MAAAAYLEAEASENYWTRLWGRVIFCGKRFLGPISVLAGGITSIAGEAQSIENANRPNNDLDWEYVSHDITIVGTFWIYKNIKTGQKRRVKIN